MRTEVKGTVSVPPETLWPTIAKGGDVHRWFGDVITSCEIDRSGVTATRTCTMADGSVLQERILDIDHEARRFRYAVDTHPLPARDVVATIALEPSANGGSDVTWVADYTVASENEAMMEDTLQRLYAHGIRALEAFHKPAS